jgi:hypothetical protein
MLVAKYFVYVGNVLIALLFLANWLMPETSAMFLDQERVDRAAIRIESARKWPEKIVIDTSQPTIVPPAAEMQPGQLTPVEAPSMSTPLASTESSKPPPRMTVNDSVFARLKVERRHGRSSSVGGYRVATKLARSRMHERCCRAERTNRLTSANVKSRRRAATSLRPVDWFAFSGSN